MNLPNRLELSFRTANHKTPTRVQNNHQSRLPAKPILCIGTRVPLSGMDHLVHDYRYQRILFEAPTCLCIAEALEQWVGLEHLLDRAVLLARTLRVLLP